MSDERMTTIAEVATATAAVGYPIVKVVNAEHVTALLRARSEFVRRNSALGLQRLTLSLSLQPWLTDRLSAGSSQGSSCQVGQG
jgi:hypothetical protein